MIEITEYYILEYGLLAAFLLMMSNGVISAPPSELILALVGAIIVDTYSDLAAMSIIISIGNLIGAYILYQFGKIYGISILVWFRRMLCRNRYKFIKKIASYIPNNRRLLKYQKIFKLNGSKWVLIFRCLPVVRSIISLPAGAAEMPLLKFLIYSYVGMCIWASIWIGFGFSLKNAWVNYQTHMSMPFIAALLLVSFYVVIRLKKLSNQLVEEHTNGAPSN